MNCALKAPLAGRPSSLKAAAIDCFKYHINRGKWMLRGLLIRSFSMLEEFLKASTLIV
ncbi:MAG: hypothetical protein ACI92W_002795 [Paraglaciecola sp.]|jgi:hypothetical protein